jgi:hypothetical protein
MSKRWMTWSVVGALATAGLGFVGARALATGAPQLSPLTYGGVLTDKDGKPYPTAQEVVVKFYDKVDAAAAKCVAPAALAEAGTGRFSVVLPGECAQAVRDTPDLWSEATVGGGKTVLPRVHVGAVPYALEADSAKVAAGATGALKAAMDGVVADVAALKKGSGGGAPKVVDGAGVVLGRLIGADFYRYDVLTSKGFVLQLKDDGVGYSLGGMHAVAFESSNCSGQAYIATIALNPIAQFAAPTPMGWFAMSLGAPKKVFKNVSNLTFEGCKPGGGGSAYGFDAQLISASDLGVPQKITSPLVIVQ